MFCRIAIIILVCVTLLSCNQTGKYYSPNKKDTSAQISLKAGSTSAKIEATEINFDKTDLQLFCNKEITPYCVLLPLHEFKEDFSNESAMKAQHKFVLKQDSISLTSIELHGFSIDKKNNYNSLLFYKRDKRDVEQGGLGIDTAYIDQANHFYLIKGYLPNYMNMKYVQLNWILEDRIAVYFNYDAKEEALWNYRIAAIIKRGVKLNDQ